MSSRPNTPGFAIAVNSAATAPYDEPPNAALDAPCATGYSRSMNGISSVVTNDAYSGASGSRA